MSDLVNFYGGMIVYSGPNGCYSGPCLKGF